MTDMTDSIKQLALRCGAKLEGGYITPSGSPKMIWSEEGDLNTNGIDLSLFANLLVAMCADAGDNAYGVRCPYVGDAIVEQVLNPTEEGAASWRTKQAQQYFKTDAANEG